jgi:hypothetical protein
MMPFFAWDGVLGLIQVLDSPGSAYGHINDDRDEIGSTGARSSAYQSGHAVKQLPAATVYAVFTGIATAGTAIIGMIFFHESTNAGRVCSGALIVIGLVGLKLFSSTN